MGTEGQEFSPLMIDSPQGYCSHGDVGEVAHPNSWSCISHTFKVVTDAAVETNKAFLIVVDKMNTIEIDVE